VRNQSINQRTDERAFVDLAQCRSRTLWKQVNDGTHLVLETNLQNAVSFVDDEHLEVLEDEALGGLQMVKKTTGRSNQEIDSLGELLDLGRAIGTTLVVDCTITKAIA